MNPRHTWAVGLAQRLASVHERRVEVVNAAVNASGYCGAFRAIHHQAAHTAFDWVVVGLFADDLEQRAVVIDDGAVYANPQVVPGLVGMLASQSYAFNAVWLQVLRAVLAHDADEVPSSFLGSGRTVPRETLDNLALSIRGVSKYKPLFILNSPAGMGYCFKPSAPPDCEWLQTDMAHLADALADSGEVWLDNQHSSTGRHWGRHARRAGLAQEEGAPAGSPEPGGAPHDCGRRSQRTGYLAHFLANETVHHVGCCTSARGLQNCTDEEATASDYRQGTALLGSDWRRRRPLRTPRWWTRQ